MSSTYNPIWGYIIGGAQHGKRAWVLTRVGTWRTVSSINETADLHIKEWRRLAGI